MGVSERGEGSPLRRGGEPGTCMHVYILFGKCRDGIVVRVLGWDMKVLGSIPADVNYTGYASDTSKSLEDLLVHLQSKHRATGLVEGSSSQQKQPTQKMYTYFLVCRATCQTLSWMKV